MAQRKGKPPPWHYSRRGRGLARTLGIQWAMGDMTTNRQNLTMTFPESQEEMSNKTD